MDLSETVPYIGASAVQAAGFDGSGIKEITPKYMDMTVNTLGSMVGIRLDSGDLAYLSIEARRMLDEAGFPKAIVVASNDLDEQIIDSLKQQGARINIWGVGTRLVTSWGEPALGGDGQLGVGGIDP